MDFKKIKEAGVWIGLVLVGMGALALFILVITK